MTDNQSTVLRALQRVHAESNEGPQVGALSGEVASAAGKSTRSAAVILSQMRDFGWVTSLHAYEWPVWFLTAKGAGVLTASTRERS